MKRSVNRVALAASVALAAALASTCDMPPTFGDEYYDTGINYIAAYPFADPPLATDMGLTDPDILLDTPARWDWPWRGNMGNFCPYMTFDYTVATVGSAQSSGAYTLAADEPVWRLELANLFIDGTFQAGTAITFIEPSTEATVGTSTSPIHGISLGFTTDTIDDYVQWHMIDLLDDISNYSATGASYYLRMLVSPVNELKFMNIPASDLTIVPSLTAASASPDSGGSLFIPGNQADFSDDNRFVLTKDVYTSSTIDDVRAIRAGMDSESSIRLRLRPTDTYPVLVPGQYEFSIWVRTAVGYLRFDDVSRTNEPYAACNVTLGIKQVDGPSITVESAVSDSWTRVAVRMQKPQNLDNFDPLTPYAVMELSITPSSVAAMDAGALEIAAPTLNFFIGGF